MEGSNYLAKKQSLEEVENQAGSYHFDYSNNKVYVYLSNDANPEDAEIRADSVERELEMSKNELNNMGLDVANFVVPYSDWSEERSSLAQRYYNSVAAGSHDGFLNDIPPDNRWWLARKPVSYDAILSEVEQWCRTQ